MQNLKKLELIIEIVDYLGTGPFENRDLRSVRRDLHRLSVKSLKMLLSRLQCLYL